MKTLKKALNLLGCLCFICGLAAVIMCIRIWDFTVLPWALAPIALGIVCLDLVGAFER